MPDTDDLIVALDEIMETAWGVEFYHPDYDEEAIKREEDIKKVKRLIDKAESAISILDDCVSKAIMTQDPLYALQSLLEKRLEELQSSTQGENK